MKKETLVANIENRTIMLQALYGSIGGDFLTVGEGVKFNVKWGKNHMSRYQVERVLRELEMEKFVCSHSKKMGKRNVRTYSITVAGLMSLMATYTFLPKSIRKHMQQMSDEFAAYVCGAHEKYTQSKETVEG